MLVEASTNILKNVLSGLPGSRRLRSLVYASPTGPSGMSEAEWCARRMSQVRQILDAYVASWPDLGWLRSRTVLELGSGADSSLPSAFCALGCDVGYATDVGPATSFDIPPVLDQALDDLTARYGAAKPGSSREIRTRGGVTAENMSTSLALVDLIVSTSTLEHVSDPRRAVEEMHRSLRAGGRMVHAIAIGNHCCGGGELDRLAHLSYPSWLWRMMWSHRIGHNRLLWPDWQTLFLSCGFRLVSIEMTRVDEADITRMRPQLSSEFRDRSNEALAPSYVVVCCERT